MCITLFFIVPTRLRSVMGSVSSELICSSTPCGDKVQMSAASKCQATTGKFRFVDRVFDVARDVGALI